MKKILIASVIVSSASFVSAQTTTPPIVSPATSTPPIVLPDPGLVPGDFFYFFDRWGEKIDLFFTFDPERKARRALKYAQERAAEAKVVLKEKGANSPEVAEAKQAFTNDMNVVSGVVADEKAKGRDVAGLAQGINDEFEASKDLLKEVYHGHREDLKGQEKSLKNDLKAAIASGDTVAQAAIEAKLASLKNDATAVVNEEDAVENMLADDRKSLEEAMGDKVSAESHIRNAERTYEMFVRMSEMSGIPVDQNVVASYRTLIASARDAFAKGDFAKAKNDARDAERVLHDQENRNDKKDLEEGFTGRRGDDMPPGMRGDAMRSATGTMMRDRNGKDDRKGLLERSPRREGAPGAMMMPPQEGNGTSTMIPERGSTMTPPPPRDNGYQNGGIPAQLIPGGMMGGGQR